MRLRVSGGRVRVRGLSSTAGSEALERQGLLRGPGRTALTRWIEARMPEIMVARERANKLRNEGRG
jgi:hypothetical protein